MPTTLPAEIKEALNNVLKSPCLALARVLEETLRNLNYGREVFGRVNQKSSIEAASESDRGITERLANAFDASLTAARLAVGLGRSDKSLTPRNAVQRIFWSQPDACELTARVRRVQPIKKPVL